MIKYLLIVFLSTFVLFAQNPSKASEDEQELRLLYQVFIYSTDLENAYKTAHKALKHNPSSLYWHAKLAEVSKWTDRREEAVKHYMYVYTHKPTKKLENELYKYSLAAYQYESAALISKKRVKKNPSQKNVKEMVYLYEMVGKPLEAAKLLKKVYKKYPSREYLLSQELEIYLNMGEMKEAGKVVKTIEKVNLHDKKTAFLVSRYYFLHRDINASYRALKEADLSQSKEDESEYYQHLSDLAWYLQEYEEGAEASVKVDDANASRLVDYERIMAVYKKKEPSRAMKAGLDAYEKFDKNYLFYSFAYLALEKRENKRLLQECKKEEKRADSKLVNEALFWMIKAQVYSSLKRFEEAEIAYKQALALDASSTELISSYMWFLLDTKQYTHLENYLLAMEKRETLDSRLWLLMAVSYFNLQNVDRSLFYVQKIKKSGINDTEIEFLYANIRQVQNEEGAYYKQIRVIEADLDKQLKQNPSLVNNKEFMHQYLRAKLPLVSVDVFDKMLEKNREFLSHDAYNQLLLMRSSRENIDENMHWVSLRLKKREDWLEMSMALRNFDKEGMKELLYRSYKTLSAGDSTQAALQSNQISFAQTLIFEGLDKNRDNELLYDQLRQLHNEYGDYFLTKTGYLSRTGLNRSFSDMHNSYYLAKGYSFETDVFVASNSIEDDEIFKSLPSKSTAFAVGIKKRFERGSYELSAGLKDSADTYNYLSFKYTSMISRRIDIELLIDKAARAEESVYLLVGGYKDRIALQTRYSLLGSTSIGLYLEKAEYSSDDGTDLGSGLNGRLDFSYLQRSAYPDLAITPYYTFGTYDEKDGSKGVIDDMLIFPDTKIISQDFWYTGVELSYGMENRYNYVRVWRPFFSVNPYYNGREKQFNYGFTTGAGGELFGQDNLAVIVEYAESVGGTDDTLWKTYFRYKILY